jgi:ribosomal protein S17
MQQYIIIVFEHTYFQAIYKKYVLQKERLNIDGQEFHKGINKMNNNRSPKLIEPKIKTTTSCG